MIFSILLLSFLVISDEHDCKFDVNGKSYDLSPLNGRTATGDDAKISTYHYTAAVCADMTAECEDIMTGQKLRGVVYQMGGEPGQQSVCWDMLAKWDSVTSGPLDSSSGKQPGTDGLTLQFQNGDPCRGSPRKTKMNMICDGNEIGTLSGFQDDSDSCLFIINFPTSHACSGATPPPGPDTTPGPGTTYPPGPEPNNTNESSSGVSVGWILIICVICLMIFYLAGFFGFGVYKDEEKNWKTTDHCPHTGFWSNFVGWVKLGCVMSGQYTWSATKQCCRWCKSKMGKGGDDESGSEGEDPEY